MARIQEKLGETHPLVAQSLSRTCGIDVAGEALVFRFPSSAGLFAERFKDPEIMPALRAACEAALGRSVAPRVEIDPNAPTPARPKPKDDPPPPEPDARRSAEPPFEDDVPHPADMEGPATPAPSPPAQAAPAPAPAAPAQPTPAQPVPVQAAPAQAPAPQAPAPQPSATPPPSTPTVTNSGAAVAPAEAPAPAAPVAAPETTEAEPARPAPRPASPELREQVENQPEVQQLLTELKGSLLSVEEV
jgi:hypothetical protein